MKKILSSMVFEYEVSFDEDKYNAEYEPYKDTPFSKLSEDLQDEILEKSNFKYICRGLVNGKMTTFDMTEFVINHTREVNDVFDINVASEMVVI